MNERWYWFEASFYRGLYEEEEEEEDIYLAQTV